MDRHEALCRCLLTLHFRNLCFGTPSRRLAALDSSPSRSKTPLGLLGFLLDAASRLEFSGHEPSPRCHGESRARFANRRHALCLAPLAESSPRASHMGWGNSDVLALRERAQHSSTYLMARRSRHLGVVGISGRMASRYACRARFLSFPLALRGETHRFRWP